jgi:hypothetical protein
VKHAVLCFKGFELLRLKIRKREDDVSESRVWKRLLTVERTVVEQVEVDSEADGLVAGP